MPKQYGTGFKITSGFIEKDELTLKWFKALMKCLRDAKKKYKIKKPEIIIHGIIQEEPEEILREVLKDN